MPAVVSVTVERTAPPEMVTGPGEFGGPQQGPDAEMMRRFMERFFGERGMAPQMPEGQGGVPMVAAGTGFSCAARVNGRASCWGRNSHEQLGDEASSDGGPNAVTVDVLMDVVSVSAGAFHACALRANGRVSCWGSNSSRQLGTSGVGSSSPTPLEVSSVFDATSVTGGFKHTCANLANGRVRCWGGNAPVCRK